MGFLYTPNLDEWRNWETTAAQWLLLNNTGTVDPGNQMWVADVVAAEVTVAGYTRQTVTGQVRTVDSALWRITYDCDDPDFGTLDTGPPYLSLLILAYDTDDDATSLILAGYQLDYTATNPDLINPHVSPSGAHWTSQS